MKDQDWQDLLLKLNEDIHLLRTDMSNRLNSLEERLAALENRQAKK